MAHLGFKKLSAMLARKGAKNPNAAAAAIGREKYGNKAMAKAAASGKPLKESQAKKK